MKKFAITAADWDIFEASKIFEVTEEIVLKEMDILNKVMFNGVLDVDAIEIDIDSLCFLNTESGFCVDEDDGRGTLLGLNDTFDSYESFRSVLAHQMIHAYQIQEALNVNHKTVFGLFGQYANQKLGLDIQAIHTR